MAVDVTGAEMTRVRHVPAVLSVQPSRPCIALCHRTTWAAGLLHVRPGPKQRVQLQGLTVHAPLCRKLDTHIPILRKRRTPARSVVVFALTSESGGA
jgi:hypothetical protein